MNILNNKIINKFTNHLKKSQIIIDPPDIAPHCCRLQFPLPHAPPPAASPPTPWLRWSMVRMVPHGSMKKWWYLSSIKGPPCISLPRKLGATDKCDFCHLGKDQFSSSVGAKEVGGGGGESRGRVEGEGDACVVSARAAVEGGRGNGCVGIISKEATLRVIMSMTLE
uniref:Uncharacterized protein n=1 Tax=Oryza nivara TaxID=4536 RepID=A0A0E0J5N9_ORYNI